MTRPAWGQSGSGSGQSGSDCRTIPIDVSACKRDFESCMQRCPKSGDINAMKACHDRCSTADYACRASVCPKSQRAGVGWSLTCRVCR